MTTNKTLNDNQMLEKLKNYKFLTTEGIKAQASILEEFLKQKNSAITHSSCLQAISKIHGFNNWSILSAVLKKK